jgi:hypothetical protein
VYKRQGLVKIKYVIKNIVAIFAGLIINLAIFTITYIIAGIVIGEVFHNSGLNPSYSIPVSALIAWVLGAYASAYLITLKYPLLPRISIIVNAVFLVLTVTVFSILRPNIGIIAVYLPLAINIYSVLVAAIGAEAATFAMKKATKKEVPTTSSHSD